jgi:hypothetical protein
MSKKKLKKAGLACLLTAALATYVGCPTSSDDDGGANNPPYRVDAGWRTEGVDTGNIDDTPKIVRSGFETHYQLRIAEVAGQKDPDGDQVFFRSDEALSYMSLNADTGLVTVDALPDLGNPVVNFWTEDINGADTSATPYTVTFTIANS